jgi:hypothetical protein
METNKNHTTHIVTFYNDNNDEFTKFSDFKTVEEFKNFLNENNLTYSDELGYFVDDDENEYYINICEKSYFDENDCVADWDHPATSDYLNNKNTGVTWSEEMESSWSAFVDSDNYDEIIEAIFNDLKEIDGVEIELDYSEGYDY